MTMDEGDLCGQALNAINEEFMRQNELGLAQTATKVDFDGVGTMPERMHRMLLALSSGFDRLGLNPSLCALGVFPILDRDKTRPALLFYSNVAEGSAAKYGRKYAFEGEARARTRDLELEILGAFSVQLKELCRAAGLDAGRAYEIVAAPYYVKPSSIAGFSVDDVVFCKFYYCGTLADPKWPWYGSDVAPENPLQQLVLFALVPAKPSNRTAVDKHRGILDLAFRNALGAFLSSAGVSAEEKSILIAQRVAAHSLLRAHEIANETRNLTSLDTKLSLAKLRNAPPAELAEIITAFGARFKQLQSAVRRLQGKGTDTDLMKIDWRDVVDQWCEARNFVRSGSATFVLAENLTDDEAHIRGMQIHLSFGGVAGNVYLCFVPAYLDRILELLYRNVVEAWKTSNWQGPKLIELAARRSNGSNFIFSFRSTGPEIEKTKLPRLFREVVGSDETPGRGTGLWSLGLAFSSHGLSYPVARNLDDISGTTGVEIEMAFPLVED